MSSSSAPTQPRKRTASERSLTNGDHLLAKKKARMELLAKKAADRQPSVEEVEDEDNQRPRRTLSSSSTHILDDEDEDNRNKATASSAAKKTGTKAASSAKEKARMELQSKKAANRQPSVEEVEDEDNQRPRRTLSSSSTHILDDEDEDNRNKATASSAAKKTGTKAASSVKGKAPARSSQASRQPTVDVEFDDMPELAPLGDDDDDDDDDSDDEDEDEDEILETPEESAEAELKRLSKDWNSPIYVFFKPEPVIEDVKGRRVHRFQCAAQPCKSRGGNSVRRYLDTTDAKSTGNLRKHAKQCWGEEAVAAADNTKDVRAAREALGKMKNANGSITAAFQRIGKGKVTYSHRQHTKTEARAEIVRWVAESKRPFQIVNDRGFRSLMKTGRPDYYIPSAETVSRDVRKVFVRCRKRISKMLKEYNGRLNFATDAWTSPNHKAYVAITVHFEHDGTPMSMLLDLVEVAKSHSGKNLAIAFANVLKDFGISDKLLSITGDNASNNDAMINELPKLIEDFPGEANQVRCFLHIVSLAAKGVLRQFEPPKSQKKGEDLLAEGVAELAALAIDVEDGGDELEDESDDIEDDDVEGLEETHAGMTPEEIKKLEEEVKPVRLVLAKLRKVAFTIKNSTTIVLPEWNSTLKRLGLRQRMMPRDVSTRWNSTYDMLLFAVDYRMAIDAITGDRDMKMRELELDLDEWKVAEQLRDTLMVFKHATLFFSRGTPNISTVIPAMDRIDEHLATAADDPQYSVALRSALAMGKRILNKYYNKTDYSEIYRIAMVLHPRHKLKYFENAGWDDTWIRTAESLVRDEFDRTYAFMEIDDDGLVPVPEAAVSDSDENMFDTLPALTASDETELRDELDEYLNTKTENVKDPIRWWAGKKAEYPRLHRMALDYLTIPATSVDVERVFSQGRLLLSHVRSRLSVQSTRALMCLGGWSLLGYVKDFDVKAVTVLAEVPADAAEEDLAADWDAIVDDDD